MNQKQELLQLGYKVANREPMRSKAALLKQISKYVYNKIENQPKSELMN